MGFLHHQRFRIRLPCCIWEEMNLAWINLWNSNVGGHSENKRVKSSLSTPWRHIQAEEVHLHTFLASAMEEGQWSPARPLSTGKEFRCPLNTRAGGSHRQSGQFWREKISCPCAEFQPRALQPVVGRYNRLRYPGSPENEIMGKYWKPRDTKESHSKT